MMISFDRFNHPVIIYRQPMMILDSTAGAADHIPASTEFRVIPTFASVPTIWDWELGQKYQELGDALGEMTELDEGDEWKIDTAVYSAACYVAAGLMANLYPAPRIFNHGPKSVVFNWSDEGDNLYLTISADQISALISSPERIKWRVDLSAKELANPNRALSFIRAYSRTSVERLIAGTVSDPPEMVEFLNPL